MRHCLSLFLCVALCGCASSITTADDVEKKSTLSEDSYRKVLWVYGPQFPVPDPFSAPQEQSKLRALVKNGQVAFYQLYHEHYSHDWYFLDSATDSSGTPLDFVKVDSSVEYGGVTFETVAVSLSRQYLDAAAAKAGLDIKIDGKRCFVIVKLPPFYIQGFLRKVDSAASRAKTAH